MSVASDRLTPSIHRLFKMAIWAGAETAVKLHIARGDDPNARDDAGLTPLMIAAARNKAAICRLLIAAGADLAALDPCGRSALAIASLTGATQAVAIIELALAGQAQPAIPDLHVERQRIELAPNQRPSAPPRAAPQSARRS